MRCPDCNKFVSFDTETDPELSEAVDADGIVMVETRIVNPCAECGTELTSAEFSVEINLAKEVDTHRESCAKCKASDEDLSVTVEGSRNDRRQTHDRNGKPIRNSRYQKQFYGAEVTAEIEMPCGETFSGSSTEEVQASSMEEC